MERTIHIVEHSDNQLATMSVETDDQCNGAIGYLSTWCYNTYPNVELSILWNDNQNEILAVYKDSSGKVQYVICAIWNHESKTFSYHS